MRAVFTHDHYGPSSHQQHGFYAALVVEPKDSVWTQLGGSPDKVVGSENGKPTLNCADTSSAIGNKALGGAINGKPAKCSKRNDGGPTSYAANIGFIDKATNAAKKEEVRREYNLAFADFAVMYNTDLRPVNPPSRQDELMLPHNVRDSLRPKPEGISSEDPGTRLLNYRNEPIPLRIAEEDKNSLEYHQKPVTSDGNGKGDMANVFSSFIHDDGNGPKSAGERVAKLQANVPHEIIDKTELTKLISQQINKTSAFNKLLQQNEPWRTKGDPSTPILAAYTGEPLKLHLIQGAQEEQHVFSMTGLKWLAEPKSLNSGYMNGQQIGISEHFEFDTPVPSGSTDSTDYWFGSPAVENLWDGMWGLVRSYGVKDASTNLNIKKLARLPEVAPPPFVMGAVATCPGFLADDEALPYEQNHRKEFTIGAWLARDLMPSGKLVYNDRFKIADPNAIMFVQHDPAWGDDPMAILQQLQNQYKSGKKAEPLILRANAGDCITVHLTNYLPETLAGLDGVDVRDSWSYNLMPPIVNGFNFNQVQGSSQVLLQPQLLAYEAKSDSGGNKIGLNSCESLSSNESSGEPKCMNNPAFSGLPKPCRKSAQEFSGCKSRQFEWYAGDVKFSDHKLPKPFEAAKELDVSNRATPTITEAEFDNTDFFVQNFPTEDGKGGWAHYTPIEFGALSLLEFGDVIKHSSHGGIAALIVEPRDAILADSKALLTQASATINLPNNKQFKEFVLLMQDDLSLQQHGQPMPNHRMADDAEDTGQKGFNYSTEPLWARNGLLAGADFNELNDVDYTNTLSSYQNIAPCTQPCDPKTPIFEAAAGDNVRFRVVHPGGHSRQHAFVLHGHNWDYQPWVKGSTQLFDRTDATDDAVKVKTARVGAIGGIGPSRHLNILTTAGGKCSAPGDYLFRVQEQFQFQGGMWGIFRVGKNKGDSKC
jgi:manganese oxidase